MPANRIARLVVPGRFEVGPERIASPSAGQVLVRVVACGVCASELHAWQEPLASYPSLWAMSLSASSRRPAPTLPG
jgi:threonine dehydrogenase-like Zn-dependent dehydrogenase